MSWVAVWVDNFDRPDSATVENGWTQGIDGSGTNAGISNNSLRNLYVSVSRRFTLWRPSTASKTRAVEWKCISRGSYATLFVGRRNYSVISTAATGFGYYAQINATGSTNLYRANGSSFGTNIGSATHALTAGVTYRLTHNAKTGVVALYADGVLVVQVVDTTYMMESDPYDYGVGLMLTVSSTDTANIVDDFTIYEWQEAPPPTTTIDALFFGAGL